MPVSWVVDVLAWLGGFSDPVAWVVVATFAVGALVHLADAVRVARRVTVAGWVLFGVFWTTQLYNYLYAEKSAILAVSALLAVPACLSVAHLLWEGRDSLFVLSRAVAVMGLLFLPFVAVEALRRPLIEMVTAQTSAVIDLLGFDHRVVETMTVDGYAIPSKQEPFRDTLLFYHGDTPITYTIIVACTGLGSMAIFGGLVAAVEAPLRRKLAAFAVSVPVIYLLNIGRNVLIAVGFGEQLFHVAPGFVMSAYGLDSRYMVSYYVVDKVLAQSLSVVALVAITYLVVRQLPEITLALEDAIYAVTRRDLDLAAAFGVDPSAAVGGDPDAGNASPEVETAPDGGSELEE